MPKRVLIALALFTGAAAGPLMAAGAELSVKVDFVSRRGQRPVAAETVIWLEPAGGAKPARPAEPQRAQIVTRAKNLAPRILPVPVGSVIRFPNEDPISHNLFSLSAGNSFDLGLYRRGAGKEQQFGTAGIVNIYCNVHPNMSAVVVVMESPWFTMADANGTATFRNVAPGKYRLIAWNEQTGSAANDIEVVNERQIRGDLTVTIDSRNFRAPGSHTNKYGKPYAKPTSRDY
ncbi:MAG TPA: hypothetical protein VMT00_13860 [Thermoanaerobaculia bacterium]|nr:hypothetical protein [Thermoanaerobaculia bacterium]